MILISAHIDQVRPNLDIKFNNGVHRGLLDNFIGVMVTYLTLYSDINIQGFERENKIKIYHNTSEEWGKLDKCLPKLTKRDIALVVDVCSNNNYKGYDVVLENVSGLKVKELKEYFKWHNIHALVRKYDGSERDEDESWYFRKRGIRTLSFTIPIESINDGWHRSDSLISSDIINKSIYSLSRLINYLLYA